MKILVTGAGGFLGSNLCNLISQEHEILAVSRKFDNICENNNIRFVKYDLTQYTELNEKFNSFQPDIVIHCAWEGGNSSKDTDKIWQVNNIIASVNLLKLCSKYQVKKFIGFGTSAEFGDYKGKFDEESVCKPNNMYGITKFSLKIIAERFCNDNNIDFSWIRPVFTYGPNDVETRLIPKVILSFLKNEDLVLNSCSAVVDYLYVEDFCKAIKSIIDFDLNGDYIISSNQEYQIKNLVENIYKKISPKCELLFDSSIQDKSPQYICSSSEKLKLLTGWAPQVTMDQGLDFTINYFKQRV